VINEDRGYVHRIEDFHFIDGIFDLCKAAIEARMAIIVVTNQAGIGRGLFTEQQFYVLTDWMTARFADRGVTIDQVYYCPHHPVRGTGPYRLDCFCRKPNPGMILQARNDHSICLQNSILIGDKEWDVVAAKTAGVGTAVLISDKLPDNVRPELQFAHVREAFNFLSF
ncbi:MAG: HAD family hydrolase, partial [Acidobacteria bacterium]|nr:HAD family hydrolase [Acidobacteriota bacterium]